MVSRRSYVRVDVRNAINKMGNLQKEIELATEDLQMEAAQIGAQKMREIVDASGTGNLWGYYSKKRGYYSKKSGNFIPTPMRAKESPDKIGFLKTGSFIGRVNTGVMLNSIGVRFERGGTQTNAAFGWIRNVQPYFYYQEYGFTAGGFRKPKQVVGMFALRKARQHVSNILGALARKYEKRIQRGVY